MVQRVGADQLVQQGHEQRAVGAGLDGNPLIGNGRVAGAHRVDGDEATACALEFGQRGFHGVAVVVFGRAQHHKQFGSLQVRPAKLPKAAAHAVDHAGGHVDRAKAAVRGVVGRAELAGKQAGERLHLVAPGEQRKLLGVGVSDVRQAFAQDVKGALPRNRLKLTRPAFAARFAQQRLRQAGGRVLLHDAGRAFGADHPLVERVVRVAVDVAHLGAFVAFHQMHPNAAAAGAHVTGGALDGGLRRGVGL